MIDQTFRAIILHIIKELQANGLGFGKTRLIKFAYLIEVEHYKVYRKRLTDIDWVFYKYGPYVMDFEGYLKDKLIIIQKDDDSDFAKIQLKDTIGLPKIDSILELQLKRIIKQFGRTTLNDLLDYVYYETEPMMSVSERGDKLDFDTVSDYKNSKIREYKTSEKTKLEFEQAFAKKYGNIRPI
jgi:hypothetical protein